MGSIKLKNSHSFLSFPPCGQVRKNGVYHLFVLHALCGPRLHRRVGCWHQSGQSSQMAFLPCQRQTVSVITNHVLCWSLRPAISQPSLFSFFSLSFCFTLHALFSFVILSFFILRFYFLPSFSCSSFPFFFPPSVILSNQSVNSYPVSRRPVGIHIFSLVLSLLDMFCLMKHTLFLLFPNLSSSFLFRPSPLS